MLQLKNISYTYDKKLIALEGVSFDIAKNSFSVVCGTTGSGKSTLLKILGGAIKPNSGELFIFGKNSCEFSQRQIDACLVSKDIKLNKNKTVYQSLAYSLNLRGMAELEIDRRIKNAAKALDFSHCLDIPTKKLPQGLKQIVSLARILVRSPKIALIDCPLDGLNDADRLTVIWAIRVIRSKLKNCTFIYATSDPFEAQFFDSPIYILRNSQFLQSGSLREIIKKPINKFVASYLGAQFLDGTVISENGSCMLDLGGTRIALNQRYSSLVDRTISIAVFLEELDFSEVDFDNAIKCEIVSRMPLGLNTLLFIKPMGQRYLWAIKSKNEQFNCPFLYFSLNADLLSYYVENGYFIDFSV